MTESYENIYALYDMAQSEDDGADIEAQSEIFERESRRYSRKLDGEEGLR